METKTSYVVCVANAGYPASLELRKIYQRIPDARAEADDLVRIIDESGEDYLYPARFFVPIEIPETVEKTFAAAG